MEAQTPLPVRAESAHPYRPNFPPMKSQGYSLELEPPSLGFLPLRSHAISGRPLAIWELRCATSAGLAGGCALSLSPGRGDIPSPRQAPHPVIGEWLAALRYSQHDWMECGPMAVIPGHASEEVETALWEGIGRLMRRNGLDFLLGSAAADSASLERALRRGARLLEHGVPGGACFFLYRRPAAMADEPAAGLFYLEAHASIPAVAPGNPGEGRAQGG